jgi:ABC-2 type transport system permease protein
MSMTTIIAKREFRSYFSSPIAYVILGLFLVACGIVTFFLFGGIFIEGAASMRRFFMAAPFIFMFLCPAVAMRLIAEERKTRSIESLLTLPVKDYEVILGKFLGALGLIAVGLAFTLAFPLSVSTIVAEGHSFDWGPVIGGYLGLLLLGASFLAIGMFTSALTQDQVVSFLLGVALCAAFVFVDWVSFVAPSWTAAFFNYLSADVHFDSIARGVLDSRDIVYFLSLAGVFLVLCTKTLSRARK